jgi:5-methylthioadenosine/S-adenosylhomocysteine deaminase
VSGPALLIRDALVVPADGGTTPPFFGWVAVDGDRIAGVGQGAAPATLAPRRVVDADGCAVLPGFVNTHAHSHSSLTRGSAEGMALHDWIATIEREQALLTDDDAHAAALATYGELLLSGTTTVVDMCLRPMPALRAARAAGIRVVVAPYVLDGRPFAPTLADVAALLDAGSHGDRAAVWVGLHDLESCADDTIRAGAELARRHATGLHLHCAESRRNVERTRARTGRSPIAQLDALGALGPRTLLAHCVWADDADVALLAARGTAVAHCPHANLKLGSGVAPVPAMAGAGVAVTLATDGAKANNRLDAFDVMKFASLLHKGVLHDPGVLPPAAVLAMATRAGARAVGIDAGAIAAGRLADLTLVDLRRFHLQPATPDAVTTNLVHAARGSDVRTVIVGGEIVVDEGRLVRVDERSILDAMRAGAAGLAGR